MISRDDAVDAASSGLRLVPFTADPQFASWSSASVGVPVMVHTLQGAPSYWLVPVIVAGKAVGYMRVTAAGKVAAFGTYRSKSSNRLSGSDANSTAPQMDAAAAAEKAAALIDSARGEIAAEPRYVHDGHEGREAWMIEVRREHRAIRWIFVTPGGVYERPAGTRRDAAVE